MTAARQGCLFIGYDMAISEAFNDVLDLLEKLSQDLHQQTGLLTVG